MKKIILSLIILLSTQSAQAGFLSTFFGNGFFSNPYVNPYNPYGEYYNNYNNYNGCYGDYGRQRYYTPQRFYPNYYNQQQPIIYRTRVRRSEAQKNEISVASKISEITALEKKILNQTFEYDSPASRVERLEQKMFGTCQSGEYGDRIELLKNASKNYKAYINPEKTYTNQYRAPIFSGTMGSGWKNMARGNFMNQFATGMPTGMTPALDPAYMDYFEAERAGMGDSNDYADNYGFYHSNTNRGTGTGVTIID